MESRPEAVGKHRPEVLLTDIEMPKMSGLELTARVKELYPDTRVLILTTFGVRDICGGRWKLERLPIFSRTGPRKNSPTRSGKSVAALASWIHNWPRRYGVRKKTRSPIENV